jgi:hypothetical protein
LLTSFDLKNENDFELVFRNIDVFTDWLRNQSRIDSQFKTLKPAFQKYLSQCGLAQLKSHRTFLDTRDISLDYKDFVLLLANSEKQKIQTIWYNITNITGIHSLKQLKEMNPKIVYETLRKFADTILKKTTFSVTKIAHRFLELNIGDIDDALLCGAQPVGLLTPSQKVLEEQYIDVMKVHAAHELATHYSHNIFIHLLLHNSYVQTEFDIAECGFQLSYVKQQKMNEKFLNTIQNAYRKLCGLDPIILLDFKPVQKVKTKQKAAVSSLGRFKSTQGVITNPKVCTDGYRVIRIATKLYRYCRVSAFAFNKPKRSDQNQVNHLNGDPSDDRTVNHAWSSASENMKHSWDTNPNRKRNHAELYRNTEQHIYGEEWREIHGIYVSNYGRHKDSFGRISVPTPHPNGYVRIGIGKKTYLIHRLIAEAFSLPKKSIFHNEVNHIDNNPSNNHASNLEWVTKAENIRHSFETNKNRTSNATKMSKPLRGRKKDTEMWTLYPSSMQAARILNLPQGNIASCARGERKIVKGYEFEWAEGDEPLLLEGEEWREVDDRVLALLDGSD